MFLKAAIQTLLLWSLPTVFAADRDLNFPLGGPGLQITALSSTKFCFFLPPNQNQTVADSEGNPYDAAHNATARAQYAVAYCTELGLPGTEGARLMPPGCLKSAHFVQGNNQVQITGQIDPAKCNNMVLDGALVAVVLLYWGRGLIHYEQAVDIMTCPNTSTPLLAVSGESSWLGYAIKATSSCIAIRSYDNGGFINVLNPIDNLFCIRCCKDPENLCGVDQGDRGCNAVMFAGVDVSPGFTDGNVTVAGPQTTANAAATPTAGANSTGNGNGATGSSNAASGLVDRGVVPVLVAGLTALVASVFA
ncbi:hypothetical protein HK097_004672 [Rhizophlyctis rosea]|uniref:Uncharacterized protein n=1 Tax=Rhizophlyctis rosea TaxID=64517 RepID=A0AAD5WZD5_9FUNG|nr:hypothetical protein HK097_004672 [Rhizophlyctis rosea]